MKLIDKDTLVAEIEKCYDESLKMKSVVVSDYWNGKIDAYCCILTLLDTLEMKEVDLKKEYNDFQDLTLARLVNRNAGIVIAKHFFELGLKANQENNVIGVLERAVKIDAGSYPCIDCYIEFYDYDKDIPLAKEGDKVKVVLVKGE